MQLLVIRHGRAKDRDAFAATGRPDAERPLTNAGIRRMGDTANGLRSLVPSIDLLVTSPLRRAVETAQIIAQSYGGGIRLIERPELAPGATPQQLIDWLNRQGEPKMTCLVGHEPDLSKLLAVLLADESDVPAKLKKGSATLLAFDDGPIVESRARLIWHRTARELASLD